MAQSTIHGFPRIGARRELKFATEGYWSERASLDELLEAGGRLRRENREFLRDAGLDLIPSNDFSYYDHVLDATALVGAVPSRYEHGRTDVDLDIYFAMARGRQSEGLDVTAMEMTKWFDTNYHYIVPELGPGTRFRLSSSKPFDELAEATEQGAPTKPVLVGPVTYLLLAKSDEDAPEEFDRLSLLDGLLEVYAEAIARLGELGADWVQLDEPAFVADRTGAELEALERAYARLAAVPGRPRICVATYFDHAAEALAVLARSGVEGIGLDLHHGRERNIEALETIGGVGDKTLFAGVVDGRNVWANDLEDSLAVLERVERLGGELVVSTSCSLLHVPIDLAAEPELDDELRSWMAFARQKVGEVVTLTRGLNEGREAIAGELEANRRSLDSRAESTRTHDPAVRERVAALSDEDTRRENAFSRRRDAQREQLGLPLFPTTTIGSFPQTAEVRSTRAALRTGEIDEAEYQRRMRAEIERVIRLQEDIGLDVLVHGEPERNDMVQYFGEQMKGFAFTQNAWVQSYGSRNVRPPIVFGDVSRPSPMTVDWTTYAQSLTDRPVKGMLTAPVTMLMWSFVRDDQPPSETCKQIALAIRDEVADLEASGAQMIQVDEPAIREGLPLRRERREEYLTWAVYCFRVATSGVGDATQIHTHMCYSEFGEILGAVGELDADVASVEAARSRMELMEDLKREGYEQEVGPGVYDIHSPRVPSRDEMARKLRLAAEVLDAEQLWVNPDCGLKTRGYAETEASLRNMVEAARQLREELAPALR
ncbi:MAG: 5-methyltetrahydropteroyltriglutamate--homocysteine S-methyltransferase [Thermoleophilaceae bacterium]|nr:5-methyltetrahydropteroyltriglutamate--homocysteine S-methyltransferase [Thermoleophilaceae bacterium]